MGQFFRISQYFNVVKDLTIPEKKRSTGGCPKFVWQQVLFWDASGLGFTQGVQALH